MVQQRPDTIGRIGTGTHGQAPCDPVPVDRCLPPEALRDLHFIAIILLSSPGLTACLSGALGFYNGQIAAGGSGKMALDFTVPGTDAFRPVQRINPNAVVAALAQKLSSLFLQMLKQLPPL